MERVDPYDHVEEPIAGLHVTPEELARARLSQLRTRIRRLDEQVVGLLVRRLELVRSAFDRSQEAGIAPDGALDGDAVRRLIVDAGEIARREREAIP